jgi:hypothetical protein
MTNLVLTKITFLFHSELYKYMLDVRTSKIKKRRLFEAILTQIFGIIIT